MLKEVVVVGGVAPHGRPQVTQESYVARARKCETVNRGED